jgi:mono/diheme cytochrome c family protein
MRKFLVLTVVVPVLGAAVFFALTRPAKVDPAMFAVLSGDAGRGEMVFHAAGCGSCHMAPRAEGDARLVLSGGQEFPSPFGTFKAPNISPSPEGIAGWSVVDLGNAMLHGTSPEGQHYYPAFPFVSYGHASAQDIVDLHAYLQTLPPSDTPSLPHEIGFPFNIRATLGGWKMLFGANPEWVIDAPDLTDAEQRGRYLVEGLGHCGECHTPRNVLGGPDRTRWLAGGPDPSGKGRIPNITPARLDWAQVDIAAYLTTGFTPDYDSVGGHMALVVASYARLPESDRMAVAAYLGRVTAVD